MFQHYRTVAELLHKAIFPLYGFTYVQCNLLSMNGFNILAYDTSATLSLLNRFLTPGKFVLLPMATFCPYQRCPARALTNYCDSQRSITQLICRINIHQ